jgi:hypothetical protein
MTLGEDANELVCGPGGAESPPTPSGGDSHGTWWHSRASFPHFGHGGPCARSVTHDLRWSGDAAPCCRDAGRDGERDAQDALAARAGSWPPESSRRRVVMWSRAMAFCSAEAPDLSRPSSTAVACLALP